MDHFEEFRTLYQFVTKGNYESLKASIDKFKEFDVNALYDERGRTLLITAVAANNLQIVRYLLELGADVNAMEESDPAVFRVQSQEMLELLLAFGANCELMTEETYTPLIFKQLNLGNGDFVNTLLNHGVNMSPSHPLEGEEKNILIHACSSCNNSYDLIKSLIERGASLDAMNERGFTPLLSAIAHCMSFEVIQLLLEHGADPKVSAQCGRNALMIALQSKKRDVIQYLLDNYDFPVNKTTIEHKTALFYAVNCGECAEEVIRKLIAKGAYVNSLNNCKNTALHKAAWAGNTMACTILLENMAYVDVAAIDGKTPLMLATEKGHIHTIHALLNYGANPQQCDKYGKIAYDYTKDKDIQNLLMHQRKRRKTFNVNQA